MANQYLALSLFIMMLSFFIILNALSNFDQNKAKPVINSLSIAFSTKDNVDELAPNMEADPLQSYRSGDGLDQIDALFKAQISGVEVEKNRLGTVMHLRMKVADFEKNLMMPIRESRSVENFDGPFLPVLISLLKSENAIPYRMDMLLNVKDEPVQLKKNEPEVLKLASRKVAAYAQTLEQAGLPTQLVTSGMKAGEPEFIDLFFYRHQPFNPLGEKRS
jgi:hypothetical protein